MGISRKKTKALFFSIVLIAILPTTVAKHIIEPIEIVLEPIVVYKNPHLVESEINCLATAIYYEARGEGRLGQKAVGTVVMNRVYSEEFPETPCQVVYQRRGSTCQFSWVCDMEAGPSQHRYTSEIKEMALRIIKEDTRIPFDAVFFHGVHQGLLWENKYNYLGTIGGHHFYSL
jgi:N-acetylmuramoyl-L-alanine amidase